MKTCPGIYEYYNKAIAIPLWTEMCVDVADDGDVVAVEVDGDKNI
jgi:hypothetical protein